MSNESIVGVFTLCAFMCSCLWIVVEVYKAGEYIDHDDF
jgi:hypothetical protein